MKKSKHPLIKGAMLLTAAGLASRVIGFFYKIFLASLIGAEGIGIYQMVFPTYILCVSLASSGIQTAISRFAAEKLSVGRPREARNLFLTGLSLSVIISLVLFVLLFLLAHPLSLYLLKEERCLPLLRLMALAIPFEALHNCANGYFLGQQKTGFPAFSQLMEQIVRVGATLLLYRIMIQEQLAPSPSLAAAALLLAEIMAALITVTVLAFQKVPEAPVSRQKVQKTPISRQNVSGNIPSDPHQKSRKEGAFSFPRNIRENIHAIRSMALPITSNRLMLNILQSVEAAMIPLLLQKYYGNSSTALSVYGIFSGMALPLIMFPCAITGSLSMVLLPSVSEAHALKNDKKIAATIHSSLLLCLFLGIVCTTAFLLFGPSAGLLLYGSEQVGSYLTTLAWICPFLYLTTTNSSILHGLGKTMTVFFHNLAGLLIRLLFSWIFIPYFGIRGCLWGLLLSQLLTAFLDLTALKRTVAFSVNANALILFPCGCCLAATGLLKFLQHLFPVLRQMDQWAPFLLSAGIWICGVAGLYGSLNKFYGQSQL